MTKLSHRLVLRASALAITATFATAAQAQQPAQDSNVGELIVTGTSIRGVASTGSPTVGVSIEELKEAGVSTAGEAAKLLPQVLNLGADEARSSYNRGSQDSAANATAVRTANLRGIGPEATLLLWNGRRLAPNGVIKSLSDIDQIPAGALSRIEVVSDGASAIYGSDAVAGVVNLITRRNYEGAETTLRYGYADGLDQKLFNQSFGKRWDGGGLFFDFEHNDRSNLAGADRAFASQNLTARGGTDQRAFTAGPGNIVISGVRYALPNGTGAPGTIDPTLLVAGTANRYDEGFNQDLLPSQKRDTVVFHIDQQVTDKVQLWYEGFYSTRTFNLAQPAALFSLSVPNTNPFYVRPSTAPAGTSETVEYRLTEDSDSSSNGYEDSYQNAFGFDYELHKDWKLSGYFAQSHDQGFQSRESVLNNSALSAALAATTTATAFNPFGNGSYNRTNNAALLDIIDAERLTTGVNGLTDYALKADGPLFSIPGGDIRAAVGVQQLNSTFHQSLVATNVLASGAPTLKIVDNKRTVRSYYGEVFVPVVSEANAAPGVHRLELSAAARVEDYSDFGSTTNPKYGLVYEPIEGLLFRGTYGTSFRAPSLVDSADQIKNIFITNLADPMSLSSANISRGIYTNGGNSALKPETADTISAGIEWKPAFADGLSVSLNYYKIEYTNRIDLAPLNALTQGTLYAPYFTRRPDAADVAGNAAFDARVAALLASPDLQNPVEAVSNIKAILDNRRNNLASLLQDGVDLSVNYRFSALESDWRLSFDWSQIFKVRTQVVAGAAVTDVLGTFGNPVKNRGRLGVGWTHGDWSANGFVNHVGSYTNTAIAGRPKVSSYDTVDATVSYRLPEDWAAGKGVRVSASVSNLFDKEPPIVINGAFSWDSNNASPVGRFASIEISKSW